MQKSVLCQINGVEIFRRKIERLPKNKALLAEARSRRKRYVLSEVLFWKQVRNGEFHGIDFDRQRIIGDCIVDFYIKSVGMVIEIDGETGERCDDKTQRYLEALNLKVYRIPDFRVKNDLRNVMRELEDFITENFTN